MEPTALFRRLVHIPFPQETASFRGGQGSRQRRGGLGVQMVQDHPDHGRLGDGAVPQLLPTGRNGLGRTPVGDLDVPPAPPGLDAHTRVTGTRPTGFIGGPDRRARSDGQGLAHCADHLGKLCIATDPGLRLVIGRGTPVEAVFHPPDELGADRRPAPALLQPGLERVFCRVRRTVSSESASTTWSATSVSARHGSVQQGRSSGGVLQARAMRRASCLPSSVRWPRGRGGSVKAASRPSATTR